MLIRHSKIALIYCLLLAFSDLAIAKNCHITKSNIYASNIVDATCKRLILPDISAEKGRDIHFACTINGEKGGYTVDNDSIVITGDVTLSNSKDHQEGYRFKTEVYFDPTKSFHINKTAKTHATIANLKFIFKSKKPDQVRIACEYNL